jgi:hypothetical protein
MSAFPVIDWTFDDFPDFDMPGWQSKENSAVFTKSIFPFKNNT